MRRIPSLNFIRDYAEHPAYIAALCSSIRASFAQHGQPDMLLFSFHGIPQRYADQGDDYPQRCRATTQAVAHTLGLDTERYMMTYQSRFGREPWLTPFTDKTIEQLPAKGIKHIQVICPGFLLIVWKRWKRLRYKIKNSSLKREERRLNTFLR